MPGFFFCVVVRRTKKKFKGAADRHIGCAQYGRPSTGGGGKDGRPLYQSATTLFVPVCLIAPLIDFFRRGSASNRAAIYHGPVKLGHVKLVRSSDHHEWVTAHRHGNCR
jgi:hypothetical protein